MLLAATTSAATAAAQAVRWGAGELSSWGEHALGRGGGEEGGRKGQGMPLPATADVSGVTCAALVEVADRVVRRP